MLAAGGEVKMTCDETITFKSTKLVPAGTSVTVDGAGHSVVFDGGGNVGLFQVLEGGRIELRGVTLRNGNALQGAGIRNAGTTIVEETTSSSNVSSDRGGAISNFGANAVAIVVANTFEGNTGFGGGAIASGIFVGLPGRLTVINSTFAGNRSSLYGGAIFNGDVAAIINSTFSDNAAEKGGHAISNASDGVLMLANTLISDNATGADCVNDKSSTITNGGGNIIQDGSCGFPATGSLPPRCFARQ